MAKISIEEEVAAITKATEALREKPYTVKKVEGFDPYEHLTVLTNEVNEPYLNSAGEPMLIMQVTAQQTWFEKYAESKGFVPAIHVERKFSKLTGFQFHARVYLDYKDAAMATETNPDAGAIGTGDAFQEDIPASKYDPFATAQTRAKGAALSAAGFGPEIAMAIKQNEMGAFAEKNNSEDRKDNIMAEPKKTKSRQPKEKPLKEQSETKTKTPEPAEVPEPAEAPKPAEVPEPAESGKQATQEPEHTEENKPAEEQESVKEEASTEENISDADEDDDDKNSDVVSRLMKAGIRVPVEEAPTEEAVEATVEETPVGGAYIITEEDADAISILETKIGYTLEDIGSGIVSSILDQMSDLPPALEKAMREYVGK